MKTRKVNFKTTENETFKNVFIRFFVLWISVSNIHSQTIERPKAQPYNIESTLQKMWNTKILTEGL